MSAGTLELKPTLVILRSHVHMININVHSLRDDDDRHKGEDFGSIVNNSNTE